MLLYHQFLLSLTDCFKVFSNNKVITIIQSRNLVYRILNFEKFSFVINVEILDENDLLLAHIMPTGANPDIIRPDPTPNPTLPFNFSETIVNTFFLFNFFISFYNFHFQI